MSRIILMSDIHANRHALKAARDVADELSPDTFWILGDVLGYGPEPGRTWTMVKNLNPDIMLAGNHDWYITPQNINEANGATLLRTTVSSVVDDEVIHVDGPNPLAAKVDALHRQVVSSDVFADLHQAKCRTRYGDNVFIAHASYYGRDEDGDPATWLETSLRSEEAVDALYNSPVAEWHDIQDVPVLHIAGHTHLPTFWSRPHRAIEGMVNDIWKRHGNDHEPVMRKTYHLEVGRYYHINPGSVGFPRGNCSCPSIALLDTDAWTITWYPTPYNADLTRQQMADMNYPEKLYSKKYLQPCTPDEDSC